MTLPAPRQELRLLVILGAFPSLAPCSLPNQSASTVVPPSRFPPPYWITIVFCFVFTPPRAFCAVTVITLSPPGRGGVK
jgi:hypothetical protein